MSSSIIDFSRSETIELLPAQASQPNNKAEIEPPGGGFDLFELRSNAREPYRISAGVRMQMKAAEPGRWFRQRRVRQVRRYDLFKGRVVWRPASRTRSGYVLPAGNYLVLDEPFYPAAGSTVSTRSIDEVFLPDGYGAQAARGQIVLWACLEMLAPCAGEGALAALTGICRPDEPRARRHGDRVWFQPGADCGTGTGTIMGVVSYPDPRYVRLGHESALVFGVRGQGPAYVGHLRTGPLQPGLPGLTNVFSGFIAAVRKVWEPAAHPAWRASPARDDARDDGGGAAWQICGVPAGALCVAQVDGSFFYSGSKAQMLWLPAPTASSSAARILCDAHATESLEAPHSSARPLPD